jgi:hypothetical protein
MNSARLNPGNAWTIRFLNVARQAHRQAVDVDLVHIQAFRLQENLVALAVGKAHHFVFERRAIARTDAGNLSVVQRRSPDVLPHEIVRARARIQHVTRNAVGADRAGHERKRHDRAVATLFGELRKIDTAAMEPGWRPGLESAHREAAIPQRRRKMRGGRLAGAAGRMLLVADMHQAVEKRAGRDNQRAARHRVAFFERQTSDAIAVQLKGALRAETTT